MRLRRRTVSAWSPKPSLTSPSLLPPPEVLAGRKAVERSPGSDGYDGAHDIGCEGDCGGWCEHVQATLRLTLELHHVAAGVPAHTRHASHVTRRTSHVARHTSHVTRHTSHVTRHTSHVTRHTSHVLQYLLHLRLAIRSLCFFERALNKTKSHFKHRRQAADN